MKKHLIIAVGLFLAVTPPLVAQTATGVICGTVQDVTGAVLIDGNRLGNTTQIGAISHVSHHCRNLPRVHARRSSHSSGYERSLSVILFAQLLATQCTCKSSGGDYGIRDG